MSSNVCQIGPHTHHCCAGGSLAIATRVATCATGHVRCAAHARGPRVARGPARGWLCTEFTQTWNIRRVSRRFRNGGSRGGVEGDSQEWNSRKHGTQSCIPVKCTVPIQSSQYIALSDDFCILIAPCLRIAPCTIARVISRCRRWKSGRAIWRRS